MKSVVRYYPPDSMVFAKPMEDVVSLDAAECSVAPYSSRLPANSTARSNNGAARNSSVAIKMAVAGCTATSRRSTAADPE